MDQYLDDLSRIDMLTDDEKEFCYDHVKDKRNLDARNRIIQNSLRFVVGLAKEFANPRIEMDDLIGEGNLALFEAFDRFDPEKGAFITFAKHYVRMRMRRFAHEQRGPFKIPIWTHKLKFGMLETKNELEQRNARTVGVDEISEHTGIGERRIGRYMEMDQHSVSIDSETEGGVLLHDRIPDTNPWFGDAETRHNISFGALEVAKQFVSEREWDILKMSHGIDEDEPMTLSQIGKRLGLTSERVRQIKDKAMLKLQRRKPQHEITSVLR